MPDRNNPKTEDSYKDTKPDIMQVFDSCKMPHMFGGKDLAEIVSDGCEGVNNDTYHRWYPDRIRKKEIGKYEHFKTEQDWEAGNALNEWLLAHGMTDEPDTFCFHVLIRFNW
jgi:hypothetical protein